jgi:hypothetical protein
MLEEHKRRYQELSSAALHGNDKWVHSRVMDGQQRAFTNLKEAYLPVVAGKRPAAKPDL